MIEINRKEALRYLGYRQSIEGDALLKSIVH